MRDGPQVVALQSRRAAQLTLLTGVACAAAGAAAAGGAGVAAAVVGALAVLGFFLAGLAPVVGRRALNRSAGVGFAILLGGYVARLVAVTVGVFVIASVIDLHQRTLGLTIMCCSLAWVLGHAAVALRHPVPLDVPTYGPGGSGAGHRGAQRDLHDTPDTQDPPGANRD